MLPVTNDDLQHDFIFADLPSKTYYLNRISKCMAGFVDGLEAVKQAIYLILNTERYAHLIYSWNYGIELQDLLGQPVSWLYPELKSRITEALLQDSRITAVGDFSFEKMRGKVHVSFTVTTIYGAVEAQKVVNV